MDVVVCAEWANGDTKTRSVQRGRTRRRPEWQLAAESASSVAAALNQNSAYKSSRLHSHSQTEARGHRKAEAAGTRRRSAVCTVSPLENLSPFFLSVSAMSEVDWMDSF